MIEKMKVVQVVSTTAGKTALLDGLRELGAVHFSETHSADRACLERFADLSALAMALEDYADGPPEQTPLSDAEFQTLYANVSHSIARKKELEAARSSAVTEADKLREWGDFDPAQLHWLAEQGWKLHFYRVDKKTLAALAADPDVRFIKLAPVGKMDTLAVLGPLPPAYSGIEFPLPAKGLAELEQQAADCTSGIAQCDAVLKGAAKYIPSFHQQMLKTQNEVEYSAVSNTAQQDEGLVWLSGYLPESSVAAFKAAAAQHGWAWAMDDPADEDEQVPTKVRYNKLTRLMIPIFDILGTVPGYREYDTSFWFLGFFTLFFAMIIGDAGYGCLFLLCAAGLTLKDKKAGKPAGNTALLLWVLSIATIVWGSLTGTWFGLEGAMHVPLLRSLVIPAFANYPEYFNVSTTQQQNTIMKFCFILGTVQLSLACVMNIRRKLKSRDLSLMADVGWLCSICALYFVVLFLVIGAEVDLIPAACAVGVGFVLVVCFGGMSPDKSFSQGLKAGLGNTFTEFLNTISAFGNIMSYIRLFAVGMASLAIAQSFNNMAAGFDGPLLILGALIMLIGHALNIVMGLLSVVVHGVRLNLLEFSGQLGMEWAGIAYDPFKTRDKLKK